MGLQTPLANRFSHHPRNGTRDHRQTHRPEGYRAKVLG